MPDKSKHYAYGEARVEVEAVMRLSAVKRWHMINTTGLQTLADHSACVAALVFLVTMRSPGAFFGDPGDATLYALFHDMPEVFTGDLPSHSKQWLDRDVLDAMEKQVTPTLFHGEDIPPKMALLIKLCDLADGIRYIRLHGVDATGRHALQGLEQQLISKSIQARAEWPAVVYSAAIDIIEFYAYETRKHLAGSPFEAPEGGLENDMARGPRNQPGGTGSEFRGAGRGVRDRVDRIESDQQTRARSWEYPLPPPEFRGAPQSGSVD